MANAIDPRRAAAEGRADGPPGPGGRAEAAISGLWLVAATVFS
jgi:hypothetical protein